MTETPSEQFLTTGQQLRQVREARKISLEQASTMTRIRLRYLVALESDDWEAFPSNSQGRGFLKAYASYLGLDATQLSESAQRIEPGSAAPPIQPTSPTRGTQRAVPSGEAESIFAQIGLKLKSQREVLGLSLTDVEQHTHLRLHYLKALENGDLDGLPSPVQGKGMLKNYAAFIGLDPEPLLLRYAEGLQARLASRRSLQHSEHHTTVRKPVKRRYLTPDMFLAGTMVLLLLGFVGWGALRIVELRAKQTPAATAPSIAEVLGTTVTPSPPASAAPSAEATTLSTSVPQPGMLPSPTSTPPFSSAAVQIYVVAKQRAWAQVTVDGKLAFEGRMIPGNAYPYAGNERIELITGNGAGLQVFYNQVDQGILGGFGEVVERIYTIRGVQTPTATITPTPAPPTPTPTPKSPTPSP